MKKVSVHRLAAQEALEVFHYLAEKANADVADGFFEELMTVLEGLQSDHGRHHFFRGDIRRANLRRYPYHVLYRVHSTQVRVLAVRHHRRHPDHGASRW